MDCNPMYVVCIFLLVLPEFASAGEGWKFGVIIGTTIGALVIAFFIILLIYYLFVKKQLRKAPTRYYNKEQQSSANKKALLDAGYWTTNDNQQEEISDGHNENRKNTTGNIFQKFFWKGQHLEEKHISKLESLSDDASWKEKMLHRHFSYIRLHCYFGYNARFCIHFFIILGMSCASFTIFWMKIRLEKNSLIYCSIGALFGTILGFHFVDPYMNPAQKKMVFVSIWFSFAVALFLSNYKREHKMFMSMQNVTWVKCAVLVLAGFTGGIFTSFSGSGVDICSFSMLTLLFNVSERVATPTSVILMATNSVIGVYWRALIMHTVEQDAWDWIAVTAPILVVAAPFGSVLSSHFHRHVLAAFVYVIEIIALITAFIIVRPGMTLTLVSVGIHVTGILDGGGVK